MLQKRNKLKVPQILEHIYTRFIGDAGIKYMYIYIGKFVEHCMARHNEYFFSKKIK